MYCEMAEVRSYVSSFKVIMTESTDMVTVLEVSCDRKSLYLPALKSLKLKKGVLKSVFHHHHHHVHEGLGVLACFLILKMKLVPPSLPRSSYVSSSFRSIL
jgi:hypothetical protein